MGVLVELTRRNDGWGGGDYYDILEVDTFIANMKRMHEAEIAKLQDKLRASEKQNEDLINSASQIMILQDKALVNSTSTRTVFKRVPRAQLAQLAENAIRALADPTAYSTFELTIDTGDAPMVVVTKAQPWMG